MAAVLTFKNIFNDEYSRLCEQQTIEFPCSAQVLTVVSGKTTAVLDNAPAVIDIPGMNDKTIQQQLLVLPLGGEYNKATVQISSMKSTPFVVSITSIRSVDEHFN